MRSSITIIGHVGRDITRVVSKNNREFSTFSLAHTPRRRTAEGEWVDETTQWYHVICFGELGANVAVSIRKGMEVIVTGRLEVRSWEGDKGRMTNLEIIADAVGPNLRRGEAIFRRVKREEVSDSTDAAPADSGADSSVAGSESQAAPGVGSANLMPSIGTDAPGTGSGPLVDHSNPTDALTDVTGLAELDEDFVEQPA